MHFNHCCSDPCVFGRPPVLVPPPPPTHTHKPYKCTSDDWPAWCTVDTLLTAVLTFVSVGGLQTSRCAPSPMTPRVPSLVLHKYTTHTHTHMHAHTHTHNTQHTHHRTTYLTQEPLFHSMYSDHKLKTVFLSEEKWTFDKDDTSVSPPQVEAHGQRDCLHSLCSQTTPMQVVRCKL